MLKPLIVLTLFLLLGTTNTVTSSPSSILSDFHALVELKQGFVLPDAVLSSWDTANSSSVCAWAGVRCFRSRVVSVDLTDMNLYGSISSNTLSTLDRLTDLSLAGNNFTGSVEIGDLSSLRFVNISDNQFDGRLDWNYSSLPNLEVLDAYDNNFRGPLPLGILSLKKLKHLNLGGNFFAGKIPTGYGEMAGLEFLTLAGNNLVGRIPAELGNLTNLRQIYLGYFNVFEGGIPAELGNLIGLEHMDLSTCGLDGHIPRELGNLASLDTLYLHTNQLSGPIPKQLGNLTALASLDLSNNALTGEIPLELSNLTRLKLLNLFVNKLHGSIPDFIAELPSLESLGLWMNNFTGEIPGGLGRNRRLQNVDLSSNKITGAIPANLCASNELRILILLKNFLFGPIPESLGSCYSLVRVRLGQNYLNGSIPGGFLYLPQLDLLELHDNYLSGALSENRNNSPEGRPSSLGEVNLSNNRLSGPLPFSLSNLSSVRTVLFGGNRFSGPIPPTVGALPQLLKLDLSDNSLSDGIPQEIGTCLHLTFLDLSRNNLSGAIPAEISRIRILSYLNLSRNHLNQSIPRSIGSMKSLTTADFSFNDLSGRVPESGQFALFNASSFAGNPLLCRPGSNPCGGGGKASSGDSRPPKRSPSKDFKLIFAVGLLFCSLTFAGAAIVKAKSFRRRQKGAAINGALGGCGGGGSWKMTAFQKLDFTVSDVLECVKDGNVIGRGGAGIVFHGKTPSGAEIAIKKLLGMGSSFGECNGNGNGGGGGSRRGDRGLRAEIETLGQIRHRNIVRLLGFCSNRETNLLVYEYMKNGSLGEALHRQQQQQQQQQQIKKQGGGAEGLLWWDRRYRIAMDAARGLCYLHHDCSPLIVHRDVKSNNILLDESFEAHVADFGLAKFLYPAEAGGGASQCMSVSAVAGSYGYIAPEYAYTLRVDEKSDVYSFGVVLLELITGRRPVGGFGEGVDIVQWAKRTTSFRRDYVNRILDNRLAAVPQDEAMHLFFIAMLCVEENSVQRPTMREVVQMLSEFPRSSPEHQSRSSSSLAAAKTVPRDIEKGKSSPSKVSQDLLA